ncbi:hypothetical protein [Chryseobacterium viscerum]|uniref:DUF4329 domain-containing protein n=1 Tax=Chryseobacterium viscerum TaxID=1037377 RepID=A0A5N4BN05_9FLAO|nr:hypothetical protein [Chryseobacterium viscerum]KAB1229804.1 hypothetical protein F8D52_16155 [Chryseobacterium viscerum]
MMTKKLFSWLLLMTVLSLMLQSCRNDYLSDQQENDYNAFRYTYKRISLEESKHKINLIPELKKVNEKLKTCEAYASGKAVKYSNGVSVNTDDVIYIERGPNVHSYTFHITRDNEPENAPLENLVLSILPDGTYKELLITYDFTSQEKQILMNDGSVDTKGKLNVEELNPGTYNGGGLVNKSDISCQWIEESYFTSCSEGQHFNGEASQSQGGPCKADQPSKMVTVVIHRCKVLPASTALGDDGTGGGGGPFGGSGGNNNGTPTIPNLVLPRHDPCYKTKTMLAKTAVKDKIDSLKVKTRSEDNEFGFKVRPDGTTSDMTEGGKNNWDPGSLQGFAGFYHSHPGAGINIFSPPDIQSLFTNIITSGSSSTVSDVFIGVIGSESCPSCQNDEKVKYFYYIIRYNGPIQDAGTISSMNYDMSDLKDSYREREKELASIHPTSPYSDNDGASLNHMGVEKLFFETLDKMNINKNNMILQRIDDNGTINMITLNSDGTTTPVPCP